MWHNGTELDQNRVCKIIHVVKQSRNFWAGLCFLYVLVFIIPAAKVFLQYPDAPFFLISVLVFSFFGVLACVTHNKFIRLLRTGNFRWTEDIVQGRAMGSRHSSPRVFGRETYHIHQIIFSFHTGDQVIAIDYKPEQHGGLFHYPFAYKI